MNRLFILYIILGLLFTQKVYSQCNLSVHSVIHSDTLQANIPFYIDFELTNNDTVTFNEIVKINLSFALPYDTSFIEEQIILGINQYQGIEAGESLSFSIELIEPQDMYQQSGDNLVVIWPSSIAPLTTDTSITPVLIKETTSNLKDYFISKENNAKVVDLLGKEYDSEYDIPRGTIYIKKGKKYIKRLK